jgi:hypothetical protein
MEFKKPTAAGIGARVALIVAYAIFLRWYLVDGGLTSSELWGAILLTGVAPAYFACRKEFWLDRHYGSGTAKKSKPADGERGP